MKMQTDEAGETQTMLVSRRRLLSSVIRCINSADFSFRKRASVVFSGKDAEDHGGLTREFLHKLLVTLCIIHVITCIWCVNTSVYVYVCVLTKNLLHVPNVFCILTHL